MATMRRFTGYRWSNYGPRFSEVVLNFRNPIVLTVDRMAERAARAEMPGELDTPTKVRAFAQRKAVLKNEYLVELIDLAAGLITPGAGEYEVTVTRLTTEKDDAAQAEQEAVTRG